jgi:hypothetical protein
MSGRKKERKRKRNAKEKKSSDTVKDDGTSLKYTLRVRYYHRLRIKQVVLGISATISLCSIR